MPNHGKRKKPPTRSSTRSEAMSAEDAGAAPPPAAAAVPAATMLLPAIVAAFASTVSDGPAPAAPTTFGADGSPPAKKPKISCCNTCKSKGRPVEEYTGHRSNSIKHCELCGKFDGHDEGCADFGKPPAQPVRRQQTPPRDPWAGFHLLGSTLVFIFWTIISSGQDIPGHWFESANEWYALHCNPELDEEYISVLERGKKDHHLHMHATQAIRMPNTALAGRDLLKDLKAHLVVQTGDGTKIQMKVLTTPQAFNNTKKYICKQYKQAWFKFDSSYIDLPSVQALGDQYGETQHGDWEKSANILKPAELLSWFTANVLAHEMPSARIGDAILWAVQAGEIRLSITFVTPKGGTQRDPVCTARFARVMQSPVQATPRDIYCILFGGIDTASRKRNTQYYYGQDGCDTESVRDPMVFNPSFYGLSRLDAKNFAAGGGAIAPSQFNIEREFRIKYDDLYFWQQQIVDLIRVPENPLFGRTIHWLWESVGNVGKSVLAAYLVDNCGAIEVAGKPADAFYAIGQFVEHHGYGPKVIVFDLARSQGDISFETIEKAKDGKFFNGKYVGKVVRYARPHVICFSNQKPDLTMLSADRYNVINLGVDMPLDKLPPSGSASDSAISIAIEDDSDDDELDELKD